MEIPLFPLPIVLFPQVIVPLHIFEERYKLLVSRCLEASRNFGIVFISSGASEAESAMRTVGVSARIVQSERLEDGRFNIMAAGEKRFRILQFTGKTPYWTGEVEFFEDDHDEEEELQEPYREVVRLFRDATQRAAQLRGIEAEEIALSESPESLSFMVSFVLDIQLEPKQELLEMRSTAGRLKSLSIYLEGAIQRMDSQIAHDKIQQKVKGNGHFKTK